MSLRHATLGLLASKPASGYDLLRVFQDSLANVWPATQSQLYAELNRLADTGLARVSAEGPRGRKEYTITDAGLAELRHWITEVEPTYNPRSDMLLRVFLLSAVDRGAAQRYLRRRMEVAAEQEADLRALADEISHEDGPLVTYGRVALEWGLRFSRAQREWAEWAVEQVAAEPTEDQQDTVVR